MSETGQYDMDETLRQAYLEGYSRTSRKLPAAVISGSQLIFDTSKANMTIPMDTTASKRTWPSITITISGYFLPWLTYAGLVSFVLLVLVVNREGILAWFDHLGRYIRRKYDELALVTRTLLWLEHNYTSLRIWIHELWLTLRYNDAGDKIVRLTDRIYFLPDNIQRAVTHNPAKVALAVVMVLWLVGARYGGQPDRVEVPMRELPPRFAIGMPPWVVAESHGRKKLGSNSHYQRQIELNQDPTVVGDDLTKVTGGPYLAGPMLRTTMQTMASKSADENAFGSSVAVSQEDKQYISMTTLILESTKTISTPEQATDFWAPPNGKTILDGNRTVWCRVCEQFHCCELPY